MAIVFLVTSPLLVPPVFKYKHSLYKFIKFITWMRWFKNGLNCYFTATLDCPLPLWWCTLIGRARCYFQGWIKSRLPGMQDHFTPGYFFNVFVVFLDCPLSADCPAPQESHLVPTVAKTKRTTSWTSGSFILKYVEMDRFRIAHFSPWNPFSVSFGDV